MSVIQLPKSCSESNNDKSENSNSKALYLQRFEVWRATKDWGMHRRMEPMAQTTTGVEAIHAYTWDLFSYEGHYRQVTKPGKESKG